MTYMRECRRCGVPFDGDAYRGIHDPHGHGLEPRGWTSGSGETPRGTRVRLLHPLPGDSSLTVGDVLTVTHTSPEHHSQNGGGYDIGLAETTRTVWSRWLEIAE